MGRSDQDKSLDIGEIDLRPAPSRTSRLIFLAVLIAALVTVLVRSAWVSEDAYITFRVVDNFWHGYGLRWNISERVCAYTNPLMLWCMNALYPLTGEFYYTSIFFNLTVTTAAASIIFVGLARNQLAQVFALAMLISSKAFVDFATSGLEQCLTYLCLAVFYWLAFRRDLRSNKTLLLLAVAAGMVTLNRMDTILMVLPLLAVVWWLNRGWKQFGLVVLGFAPFILWEVFSLIYYGTPLPNTAYAKLGTGLPMSFYLRQGLIYYTNSLQMDPVTLPIICGAIVVSLRSKHAATIAAAAGIVLYLLYILRIGGGFMSGRHFSGPFIAAVMLWCVNRPIFRPKLRRYTLMVVAGGLVLMAAVHPLSPVRSGADYPVAGLSLQDVALNGGVADERGFYYGSTGLLNASKYERMPGHGWWVEGEEYKQDETPFVVRKAIGIFGVAAGPGIHIIDSLALSDPFLARMPISPETEIRIGHMERKVTREYTQSAISGKAQFSDPHDAKLFESLHRIHSGPIWNKQRWKDIWRLYILHSDDG